MVKEDCYWYKHKMRGQKDCGLLVCLQCKINGTCSFYETEDAFCARQRAFKEQHGGKKRETAGEPVSLWERMGITSKEFFGARRGRKGRDVD